MVRPHPRRTGLGGLAVFAGLAGLLLATGRAAADSPAWAEKAFPLRPGVVFVKASFLTGELDGLKVVERVDQGTGKVVRGPVLEATLTVSNGSRDQAARLLGGKIEYIDGAGRLIPMTGNSFVFASDTPHRLDPGRSVSQPIRLAFPPSALQPHGLREVSVELTYLPIPYKTDTVYVPVYIGG